MSRFSNSAALLGLVAILFSSACETRQSLIRKRIKNVEKGLLRTVFLKGTKPEKPSLSERMSFYKVPAVSLVVLAFETDDQGAVCGLVLWQQDFEQKAKKIR